MAYVNENEVLLGVNVIKVEGGEVAYEVDQTYNPESANPQSGTAVAEAIDGLGNSWQKVVDITTTEEANGIMATVEEFPDLANCKEFIVRVIFPKSPTGANLTLGASRIDFNTKEQVMFRFSSTTVNASGVSEQRCHCVIADELIHSTGLYQTTQTQTVAGDTYMLVGDRFLSNDINNINYYLNDTANFLPIGTKLEIYGKKVEIGESAEAILNKKLGDIETLLGGI